MWRYNGGSRTLFLPPGVFYYQQYFVPSKVKFSIFVVNKDTPLDVASLRNIFEFKRIGVGSDVSGASTTWSYTIGGNAGFSGKELNLGASAQISWTTSYSKGVKGQPDTKNEYEFLDAYHYEIADWFLYWPIVELKVERKGIHLVSWEYDFYEQGGHRQMALSGAFEIAIANSYAHLQKFDNFEFIIKVTIEYQKYERMEWPIKLFFTKLNEKKSYSMKFRLGDGKGDFDSTIYMLQTKIFKE